MPRITHTEEQIVAVLRLLGREREYLKPVLQVQLPQHPSYPMGAFSWEALFRISHLLLFCKLHPRIASGGSA